MQNFAKQATKLKSEALDTVEVQEELIWRTYQNTEAEIGCLEAAYFGTGVKRCHMARLKKREELAHELTVSRKHQFHLDNCLIKLGLWKQSLKAFRTDASNLERSMKELLQLISKMKTEAGQLGLDLVAALPPSLDSTEIS